MFLIFTLTLPFNKNYVISLLSIVVKMFINGTIFTVASSFSCIAWFSEESSKQLKLSFMTCSSSKRSNCVYRKARRNAKPILKGLVSDFHRDSAHEVRYVCDVCTLCMKASGADKIWQDSDCWWMAIWIVDCEVVIPPRLIEWHVNAVWKSVRAQHNALVCWEEDNWARC